VQGHHGKINVQLGSEAPQMSPASSQEQQGHQGMTSITLGGQDEENVTKEGGLPCMPHLEITVVDNDEEKRAALLRGLLPGWIAIYN
jgi:hypothetical protein